jgi:N-acetyl-gamma-glutamyl-phosphate reductase
VKGGPYVLSIPSFYSESRPSSSHLIVFLGYYMTVRTAVIGASGYTGVELLKLLSRHSRLAAPLQIARDQVSEIPANVSVLFLATPHEFSRDFVPEAIRRGLRVVDLSGAWRLKSEDNRRVYDFANAATTALDEQAVYGLPELHREAIRQAQLIANPGCYPTSIILAIAPLVQAGLIDAHAGIICDSKSGVSGAGKAVKPELHFMAVTNNFRAYNPVAHRHRGELLEQLHLRAADLTFTPHLLPIARGMFSTIYLRLQKPLSTAIIGETLAAFHATSPFVRILPHGQLPEIASVVNTNYCEIGYALSNDGQRLTLFSCIDNLVKGASGQAVQNMNLMMGWPETEGLL